MKRVVTMIALAISVSSFAQTRSKAADCGCGFRSINQAGLLQGEGKSAGLLQTINGFYYKQWFAGVGTGLDYYHTRSVPVFLDLRMDVFKRASSPFVYASGGISYPWATAEQKTKYGYEDVQFRKGNIVDLGIGYRFGFLRNQGLLISAGYSRKTSTEDRTEPTYCIWPPCPVITSRHAHTLERLALKVGWQL